VFTTVLPGDVTSYASENIKKINYAAGDILSWALFEHYSVKPL